MVFSRLVRQFATSSSASREALSKLHGYTPAVAALGVAMAAHFVCASTIGIGSAGIFFLYLMAVLIAAWCGYLPGLLVLFLALSVAPYTYRKNFSLKQVDLSGVAVLVLVTLITSQVSANPRRTEAILRSVNDELDQRVRQQLLDLERVNSALRDQFAELETVYRKIPVGICFLDPELRFVRINEKLAKINGARVDAHTGREVREMLPPSLAIFVEPLYRNVLKTGQPLIDYEVNEPLSAGSGQRSWNIECSRVETDDGAVLGLQVIVLDVTERNRAHRALSRANEELARFAYIAAHDLQEPLRTVVNYSQLIQRKSGRELDADTDVYLGYVVSAAKRMSQLIRDVLTYSRAISDTERPAEKVDLEKVFGDVIGTLQMAIEESRAQIIHDPLPVIEGDASGLNQVFHNVIGNALKYRRSGVPLEVRVSAMSRDGEWVFSVQDNGQGFKNEYADRVFGMFKRLHGSDVPGSGIGLAICKAVIERHGGRIWAAAAPGEGATIAFTLPARSGEAAIGEAAS